MTVALGLTARGNRTAVASYDFNDGFQGWDPGKYVGFEWVVTQVAPPDRHNSFSRIDPDDVSSLFMVAPRGMEDRTKASIFSPEIRLEENSELSFYVGFYSYYDTACRLLLDISEDDFVTSKTLWNSKNVKNDSWGWMPITVDLTNYNGKTVKFRFLYTTGSNFSDSDLGGCIGDFAIDNFVITGEIAEDEDPEDEDPNGGNPDEEEPTLGVEALPHVNAETFYTIDGRKVLSPAKPGVYIRVTGGATEKILVP